SIVFRSDAPNWEKSHVRPSCPPKSAWHVEQVTYDASCDVLTTLPGTRRFGSLGGSLKSGAAWPSPIPFGTLESRAAVLKRFFPSSTAGETGSGFRRLDTGCPRRSGTQSEPLTHGPFGPQSAFVVHCPPPGWLQNPTVRGQSLSVPHAWFAAAVQRKLTGRLDASRGDADAATTTFRER